MRTKAHFFSLQKQETLPKLISCRSHNIGFRKSDRENRWPAAPEAPRLMAGTAGTVYLRKAFLLLSKAFHRAKVVIDY